MSTAYILAKPTEFNTKVFLNELLDAGLPKILPDQSNVGPTTLTIAFETDLPFEQFATMTRLLAEHNASRISQAEALRQLYDLYTRVRDTMYVVDPTGNEWGCTLADATEIQVGLQVASASNGNPFPWLDRQGVPIQITQIQLSQLRTLVFNTIASSILNYNKHYTALSQLEDAAGYDMTTGWPEYEI